MQVYNHVDEDLIDWVQDDEPIVAGCLFGSVAFANVAEPHEFEHHVRGFEERNRLRSQILKEIVRASRHVPHLSVIDDNTLDEVEAELAMEMGWDPVDLCRREIEAHAHKVLGPIIAELPETWGVIPELRSIGEVVDVVVCRSFASDAERKAFELGKPARFQWLLRLNLDLRAHGYRNNVEEAFNEIAVALCKCGPAIFYQARFRKSALSQEEWDRLSRKSVFSLRRRRARRSPVTKTV